MYDKGEGIKRAGAEEREARLSAEEQTPIGPIALAQLADTSKRLRYSIDLLTKQLDPILNPAIQTKESGINSTAPVERWPPLFSEIRTVDNANRDSLDMLKNLIMRIAL